MASAVISADTGTLEAIRSIRNRFGHAKFVESNERLAKIMENHRDMNAEVKILLVLGTYDLFHVGHARYLQRCREKADIVVVIVDPDAAVKLSKGKDEDRPVVPEWERLEVLAHCMHTDYVAFMETGDYNGETGLWLRKPCFHPDVMVISKRSPSDAEHEEACAKVCGELVILESQAETSTTAKIRLLLINNLHRVETALIAQVQAAFEKLRGGG